MFRHRRLPSLIATLVALVGLGQVTASCIETAAVGASTAGTTDTEKRGFSTAMSDTRIRLEINHYWFQASEEIFSEINLQVREGRVLLRRARRRPAGAMTFPAVWAAATRRLGKTPHTSETSINNLF